MRARAPGRMAASKTGEAAAVDCSGGWIQEAVVRFLQGPCYTTPLMGFIDAKCIIFDTEVRTGV